MAAALKQAGKTAAVKLAQQILQPAADKIPTVVFLGPPGVGKGTYSSRIAKELDLAHISVGDLVRSEIKAQTELGRVVSHAMLLSRVELVAFSKTLTCVRARLLYLVHRSTVETTRSPVCCFTQSSQECVVTSNCHILLWLEY